MKVGIVPGKGSAKPEADSERDTEMPFFPSRGLSEDHGLRWGVLRPGPGVWSERMLFLLPRLSTLQPERKWAVWRQRTMGRGWGALQGSLPRAGRKSPWSGVASTDYPPRNGFKGDRAPGFGVLVGQTLLCTEVCGETEQ